MARAIGLRESVADYGSAFLVTIGAACVVGLMCCYLALRIIGDCRALSTTVLLSVLLPGVAFGLDPLGSLLGNELELTYGFLIPLGVILYVLCVVLTPMLARLVAGYISSNR